MPNNSSTSIEKPSYHKRQDTVADVHHTDDGHVHVLMHGSPQVFMIHAASKQKNELVESLTHAKDNDHPIHVTHHTHTNHINRVKHMTDDEKEEHYAKLQIFEHPDKQQSIDVNNIDPINFDQVGTHLKSKAFRNNKDVVASYQDAKMMFDYCVEQGCQEKKTAFTPPIPFQYLQNGCFARAHKMRQIMEEEFHFRCLKAFCFARKSPNYLSVRAEMWGGCCIPPFWFHVAPLIRVRANSKTTVALVFDPSLHTRPVLLSTWIMGLVNKACYKFAHMTDFSIQPGEAYGPMTGGKWLADPDYIYTNEMLEEYAKLESCPKKAKSMKLAKKKKPVKKKKPLKKKAAVKKAAKKTATTKTATKKTATKKTATKKTATKKTATKKTATKKVAKPVSKKKTTAKKKAVAKKKAATKKKK